MSSPICDLGRICEAIQMVTTTARWVTYLPLKAGQRTAIRGKIGSFAVIPALSV